MPQNNRFRHQSYPTAPMVSPTFHRLAHDAAEAFDFSDLHTKFGVSNVVVVHGTFMGSDPFAIAEILRSLGGGDNLLGRPMKALADEIQERLKPLVDSLTEDIGNYTKEFAEKFQQLVGDDPRVERLNPTWSGQNHHLARADLAVRLLCHLDNTAPAHGESILLWGHSHAGNGFALLSNLLANDRAAVKEFFAACGRQQQPHWQQAQHILAEVDGPHPLAQHVDIVAFGTPVRYGWDSNGYRSLIHVLHHKNPTDHAQRITAEPVFPFQSITELLTAEHGDWVQAFGIVGTDVSPPTSTAQNAKLIALLEASLTEPTHRSDTRFLPTERIRNLCARWKTGTRCHADGANLLVSYEPCGRRTTLDLPIEESLLGHGVATTTDWLPSHLQLVMESLGRGYR